MSLYTFMSEINISGGNMTPPHELKKVEFSRVMRGYNSIEVDEYINYLTDCYTDLYREFGELESKLTAIIAQNNELVKTNEAAKSALKIATNEANTILEQAKEEADTIIRSAKTSCDNILNEFRIKTAVEKEKLEKTEKAVNKFKTKLYKEYQQHIDFIENLTEEADTRDLNFDDEFYMRRIITDIKTDLAQTINDRPSEITEPSYGGPDPVVFDLATEAEKQEMEAEPEEATLDISSVEQVQNNLFTKEINSLDEIK